MVTIKYCSKINAERNTLAVLTSFTTLKMISAIITLIYFSIQLHSIMQFDYIYDYKETNRTLKSVTVVYLSKCDKWITVYTSNNNEEIVENPFNAKDHRTQTFNERRERPIDSLQSCSCRPKPNGSSVMTTDSSCYVWATCFFNADFIVYIQRDSHTRYIENISFIVGSALVIVLSMITVSISFSLLRNTKLEYVELSDSIK